MTLAQVRLPKHNDTQASQAAPKCAYRGYTYVTSSHTYVTSSSVSGSPQVFKCAYSGGLLGSPLEGDKGDTL